MLHKYDAYQLWLGYVPVSDPAPRAWYRSVIRQIVLDQSDPLLAAAGAELEGALPKLVGQPVPRRDNPTTDGAIILTGGARSRLIAPLQLSAELQELGDEGFIIKSVTLGGH